MNGLFQAIRRRLAEPSQGRIVVACCVVLLTVSTFAIFRHMSSTDPRTVVELPKAFNFACAECGRTWHAEPVGSPPMIEGQVPHRDMVVTCPACSKRAGRLLEACPWCGGGLPRNAATRICPHCNRDPDEWTAGKR